MTMIKVTLAGSLVIYTNSITITSDNYAKLVLPVVDMNIPIETIVSIELIGVVLKSVRDALWPLKERIDH